MLSGTLPFSLYERKSFLKRAGEKSWDQGVFNANLEIPEHGYIQYRNDRLEYWRYGLCRQDCQ